MSLSLLLEKYDVSTDEGLAKALSEIEKEELEVDEALSNVLSRSCVLEGRLKSASQAYTKLGEVKADTLTAAEMVHKTAALAKDVSAKVRQLDLARSRVAECQRRVHDLIDLQLCSVGVEEAIKAHDYEKGAAHVARFLALDPRAVAAASPDPRADMAAAAHTLALHLLHKFEEAARRDDAAAVERLFKLFPEIGKAEEGVNLFAKYLAAQTETALKRGGAVVVVEAGEGRDEWAGLAGGVARALEVGAAATARYCAAAAPPGLLPTALRVLQPTVCGGVRAACGGPVGARRVPVGAAAAEPAAHHVAAAHRSVLLYFAFLRRKAQADVATLDEDAKKKCIDEVEKIIADCELTRIAQDLLSLYLKLERLFLEENVNKALKMAVPQPGVTTSSLVDDVFFIARKSIRRSTGTGSVEGVCAVLNEAGAQLEAGGAALGAAVRGGGGAGRGGGGGEVARLPPPPAGAPAAAAAAAAAVLDAAGALAARLNRDLDAQRLLLLAHLNEAELGVEWAGRLAAEACEWARGLVGAVGGVGGVGAVGSASRVESCAAGVAAAGAAFGAARDAALAVLRASLQARLSAWAKYLVDPEETEGDAEALPMALDAMMEDLRENLSENLVETIMLDILTDLAAKIEARILQNYYDRDSGIVVELRVRRLASWAGSCARGARERLARAVHSAALLAIDSLAHAHSAPRAKEVLARRTDFKLEDIKRLKL